jgi:hypothetical protein
MAACELKLNDAVDCGTGIQPTDTPQPRRWSRFYVRRFDPPA